jgi:hypothetical protein
MIVFFQTPDLIFSYNMGLINRAQCSKKYNYLS